MAKRIIGKRVRIIGDHPHSGESEVVADSVQFLDKPKEQETRGDLTSGGSVFDNDDIPF